jgi:deoxyribodipyrimidine photolyase-related protein
MSQFADGGIVATKPYVSSGNYINKMSDYCKNCHYQIKLKAGEGSCPFNSLYWHFINRNKKRLEKNPRMAMSYRTWNKMAEQRRRDIMTTADSYLGKLSNL